MKLEFITSQHYQDHSQSWYYYLYNSKGELQSEGYTKKDEKGNWPRMKG